MTAFLAQVEKERYVLVHKLAKAGKHAEACQYAGLLCSCVCKAAALEVQSDLDSTYSWSHDFSQIPCRYAGASSAQIALQNLILHDQRSVDRYQWSTTMKLGFNILLCSAGNS